MIKFISLCFFLFLNVFNFQPGDLYPRIRFNNKYAFPKKFRVINGPYRNDPECEVTREGLDKCSISTSGQFSENSLRYIMQQYPSEHFIVLDLRREFHGYVNGDAVSWKLNRSKEGSYFYNLGLGVGEIEEKEHKMLQDLLTNKIYSYNNGDKGTTVSTKFVQTERELVEKLKGTYVRIPIIDHHHPSDEEADKIVELVKSLPKVCHLHLHCAAGEGRSTTAMCMIDMMLNSHLSSLEIMQRQRAIGGTSVFDPEDQYVDNPKKLPLGIERRDFLNFFHRYCVENPQFTIKWSDWKKSINDKLVPEKIEEAAYKGAQ